MFRLRLPAALVAVTVVSGIAASTALGHTEVQSTYPGNGKTVGKNPGWASVTFKSPIRGGSMSVSGPGGSATSGRAARDPRNSRVLRVKLRSNLRAGTYKTSWVMRHTDGHTLRGSFSFKVK